MGQGEATQWRTAAGRLLTPAVGLLTPAAESLRRPFAPEPDGGSTVAYTTTVSCRRQQASAGVSRSLRPGARRLRAAAEQQSPPTAVAAHRCGTDGAKDSLALESIKVGLSNITDEQHGPAL